MTERLRSASTVDYQCPKMENDLSPRKTMVVLVIVVGCFAVLWPKVFYPMLVGSADQYIKPNPIDKTSGCCDVISETDVNTIKIMSELCGTIIKGTEDRQLTGKEIVQRCRQEILDTCGIDISVVLQEKVGLVHSVKQILDEIRSLNGSLCLKYNYGLAPWRLGVPHRVTVKSASDTPNIRQERPMHLRAELVHPAFRERGRAIPQPQAATPSRPPPRVVEGRPGPIPGMRPTIGGAGHVVPPSKQGTSSMSVIMPIYTIGIVIFFTYTLMKIIFKKQPENAGSSIYPPVDPDQHFRKEVFESESSRLGTRLSKEHIKSTLVVNAMSALLDEVDQEIEARRKSSAVASQDLVNGSLSNGDAVKPQDEEQPTVKVLGMEMTASCEGGKKWSRPESPVLPTSPPPPPVTEPVPPPQEIYLEGTLPAQSQLLVAESAIEPEPMPGEDPAVVLSGKMTLSVISLDSENGAEEMDDTAEICVEEAPNSETLDTDTFKTVDEPLSEELPKTTNQTGSAVEDQSSVPPIQENTTHIPEVETEISNFTQDVPEQSLIKLEQNPSPSAIEKDIEEFLQSLKAQQIQAPSITLESGEGSDTLEVESLEREVDDLIQEAIQNIQERNTQPDLSNETNENIDEIQNKNEIVIDEIPETNQSSFLQIRELKETSPSKFDINEEISAEIGKLIQEVKDLPILGQKLHDEVASSIVETGETSTKSPTLDVEVKSLNKKSEVVTKKEETPATNVTVSLDDKTVNTENAASSSKTKVAWKPVEPAKPSAAAVEEESAESSEEDDNCGSDQEYSNETASDISDLENIEPEIGNNSAASIGTNPNRTKSSSVERVNGEQSDDLIEESKYTTVSGATAAENDISDEEQMDSEECDEEEEVEEIIEVEEEEEEIIEVEEGTDEEEYEEEEEEEEEEDVNHVSGESEESEAEL